MVRSSEGFSCFTANFLSVFNVCVSLALSLVSHPTSFEFKGIREWKL